jgi:hypothetical protein
LDYGAPAVVERGAALRVCNDHAEASRPQLVSRRRERVSGAVVGRLEKHPARSLGALRHGLELRLAQAGYVVGRGFASADQLHRQALARELGS